MYGKGLFKGLGVTFKHWFRREFTEQYPEQRPDLPPASQSFFDYKLDKCIACGLCVRACPNQVISMTTDKDENNKKIVTSYRIELDYCLYCGLCIEACPTAALLNAPNFELSCYHRKNLHFEYLDGTATALNNRFDQVQADYWTKKRPGGNPIGMPTPVAAAASAAKTVTPEKADEAAIAEISKTGKGEENK